jgi:hypothetical protein
VKLGLIVEGHGETQAVPTLLRRLALDLGVRVPIEIPPPMRVPKGKLVKHEELRRAVDFMARKTVPDGALLVLLDADTDCPGELGPQLLKWAKQARADREVAVVLAKYEFESWFLAAAHSLSGRRGLPSNLTPPADPESIRDPKGWLDGLMPDGYSETLDQPAFAATFDWHAARHLPSFAKLLRDLRRVWNLPMES